MLDYEKIISDLEESSDKTLDTLTQLEEKKELMEFNSLDKKLLAALDFGVLPMIASWFIVNILFTLGSFPLILVSPLVVGTWLGSGLLLSKLSPRGRKLSKKFKQEVGVMNSEERLEAKTEYDIEIEKLKLKRALLDRVKERLIEEEAFYQQALSKYEVSEKSDLTKKELIEKGKQLEKKIAGAKENLDQLVTQDVLMKNFSNIRKETKPEKWVATLGESYLFPLWISSLVSPIPSFVPISSGRISISLLEFWFSFLLSSIPLAITNIVHIEKKIKVSEAVFKRLNDELEEHKISVVPDENEDIELECNRLFKDLCHWTYELAITQNRLAQLNHQENISHLENMQRTNVSSYDREETLSMEEHVSKQLLMDTFHELAGISYEEFRQLDLDKQQHFLEQLKQDQNLEPISMLMENNTTSEKAKQIVKQLT